MRDRFIPLVERHGPKARLALILAAIAGVLTVATAAPLTLALALGPACIVLGVDLAGVIHAALAAREDRPFAGRVMRGVRPEAAE